MERAVQAANELCVFSTPWHWVVHGLGLGQRPTGFDVEQAERVSALNRALLRRFRDPFQVFVHELVKTLQAHCEASAGGLDPWKSAAHGPLDDARRDAEDKARTQLVRRITYIEDPIAHARACALLVESFHTLSLTLDPSRTADALLRESVATASYRLTMTPAASEEARYERLHLLAGLFLAAGRAGWGDLMAAPSRTEPQGLAAAWRLLGSLSDPFYRGRGAAIFLTILGLVDPGAATSAEVEEGLRSLLNLLDAEFQRAPERASDGVHEGRDYRFFPLSLALIAMSVLGRRDLLHYKRDWLDLAGAEIERLTPASRASQALFYVAALRSLDALETHVPAPAAWFGRVTEAYLGATDGRRVDDYLRCTYLVHLAEQLGLGAAVPPRIGEILAGSVARIGRSESPRTNPYDSGFMTLAYALSTLRAGGPATAPWTRPTDLARAVGRIEADPHGTALHLPRLNMALIDAALRLRSPVSGTPRC